MAPAVSVIITCYNLGRFLDEAVDSVLAQTYQDFDILIVDDGSTDSETVELLKSYQKPKTRIVRVENRGLPGARNEGIRQTSGKYVCTLDADDRLAPTYLEKSVAVLDTRPEIAFVSHWLRTFGDDEHDWTPASAEFPALLDMNTINGAALTRREALFGVGLSDESMRQGCEDWDLWIGMVERGYRGHIIPEVLFHYRQRSDSMSREMMQSDTHVELYRYMVQKHRSSFAAHAAALISRREIDRMTVLAEAHDLELDCGSLAPEIERRRDDARAAAHRLAELDDREDIAGLRSEIRMIRSSRSWRLTRPLRTVYSMAVRATVTSPQMSIIVDATSGAGGAFGLVELVVRSVDVQPDIVVACGSNTPRALIDRLQSIWPTTRVRCVTVRAGAPGGQRNEAIAAAQGDAFVFLEPGDTIDPAYLSTASARLGAEPHLDFVTAWARMPAESGLQTERRPNPTLSSVLNDLSAMPGPTVFCRSAWARAGGFDEVLPALEWPEFWIRLLAGGGRGAVIETFLIGHEPSRDSAYRRRLAAARETGAIGRVVDAHLGLYRDHLVDALCDRERSMRALAGRYRRLLRRRDALVAERTRLRDEAQAAAERLRAAGAEAIVWDDLRRTTPVSADWGYERGTPIDRYYIERFLEAHAADVQGRVLEIQEADYTRRFGRQRVTHSDVIDVDIHNTRANLNGDLRRLEGIPSNTYDCFILTQTIHVINDMAAVIREAVRILKPGGVLLVTMPCASRVCLEYGPNGDFWRVTEAGARELFRGVVPTSHQTIQTFGNPLATLAFTAGLACQEISAEEFESYDPFNPTLVGIRAVKPGVAPHVRPSSPEPTAVVLLYHRVTRVDSDVHGLAIAPEHFRMQMDLVRRDYQPVSLAQLASAFREGWLPERGVAVTFDDGYLDNLVEASPILLEAGIPATFFFTDHALTGQTPFWWDVLESAFFGGDNVPTQLQLEIDGQVRMLSTATAKERADAHWTLYHVVRTSPEPVRSELVKLISEWSGRTWAQLPRVMSRAQLVDLSRRPRHSIGGHGAAHLSYSAHPDAQIRHDVIANRWNLEAAIGRPVTMFAYPYGDHDDRTVEIVDDAGYRGAVTCVAAAVRPGADPLRLPRIAVLPTDEVPFDERLRQIFRPNSQLQPR